ncbi:MAG: hypothetical protein AAF500_20615 [Myxococcota bacterium]
MVVPRRLEWLGLSCLSLVLFGCDAEGAECTIDAECFCFADEEGRCVDGICQCGGDEPDGGPTGGTSGTVATGGIGGAGAIPAGGTGGSAGAGGDGGMGGVGGGPTTCGEIPTSEAGDITGDVVIVGPDAGPIGTEFTFRVPVTAGATRFVYNFDVFEPEIDSIGAGVQDIEGGPTDATVTFESMGGGPGTYPLLLQLFGAEPDVRIIYATEPDCSSVVRRVRVGNDIGPAVPVPCAPVCLTITDSP